MPRGQRTPDDVKAAAVAAYTEHGLAEAARQTGLPRASIRYWANEAGVKIVARTSEVNRLAAYESAARRRRLAADAAERTVTLLTVARDLALQQSIQLVKDGKASVHELVGVWTRATHDLALIEGRATERVEIDHAQRVADLGDQLRAFLAGADLAADLADEKG